ncbi:protein VAPYRIN-like [Malania oleifera]|uniref:protein VAPYRIN-like n=1 Tax=Malania oleifera TaxID=397392 RepID=UPI0025AE9FF2|nr:protein VAPYRIN-like [Malania oleifera]
MDRLVELSEQEVLIDFALNRKCRATVRLTSLTSTTAVAFKVQTSSPHKFLVSPPFGVISPSSSSAFQVVLKPQSQLPSSFPRSPSDRFLIKTLPATESTRPESVNSLFSSAPPNSTRDLKLKVAFVGPVLLLRAVALGDYDAVAKLIKRQKSVVSGLPPAEAESLLRMAGESSNSEAVTDLLIESGLKIDDARVAKWESKGWTKLHVAAAFDRTEEIIREGLGTLDGKDKEGRTALHVAASRGNARCVELLIGAGADMDARSNDGRTALYIAAANGNRRTVEILVGMGADPTNPVDRGRSPLDIAREKGHKEVAEVLERGEEVLTAARRGEAEHLRRLLQSGATANHRDQYGLTPLHAAAIKGHRDAALVLIAQGIDVECEDSEGHRPLHLAVEGGSAATVEAIVCIGRANVNAKTKRGATPLYMATTMGYDDVVRFLLEKGAASSSSPPSLPSSSSSLT